MEWFKPSVPPVWKRTGNLKHDERFPGIVAIYPIKTNNFEMIDTPVKAVRGISFKEAASSYVTMDANKRQKVDGGEVAPQPDFSLQGQFAQNGQFQAGIYGQGSSPYSMNQGVAVSQ